MSGFDRPLPPSSLAVVGAPYVPERRFEILLCKPGEPVELRLDPKNRHDALAVAVISARGIGIGYLSADRCGRIGGLIRQGRQVTAVFQRRADFGAWIRVAFDGEEPVLPAPHEEPVADFASGFEPDPVWDDD